MINFNKIFGHRISGETNIYYFHKRYRKSGVIAACNDDIELWYYYTPISNDILYGEFCNVCPLCLSLLDKDTIDQIKMYFIIKKLKG